jgi:glucose-6-phosphate 1-dehydrogenase
VTISPEELKASQHSERSPDPCVVVIFGASGDLTKRKLLPALYHLEQAGNLPAKFAVVGVARRPLEQTFAADMKEGIETGGGVEADDPKLDEFVGRICYHQMNFDDDSGYEGLKELLTQVDAKYGTQGNRLFYLATAPEYFSDIVKYLGEHGMNHPGYT